MNANSKVDFKRNPPNIMKLWRLRYCGCIIWTEWMVVLDMYTAEDGFRAEVAGSW